MAGKSSRSRVIEEALLRYFKEQARAVRDERDREILNRVADRLNAEMAEFLELQIDV